MPLMVILMELNQVTTDWNLDQNQQEMVAKCIEMVDPIKSVFNYLAKKFNYTDTNYSWN